MFNGAPVDALDRIASRAADLRAIYRAGAQPQNADVRSDPVLYPANDPLAVALPPNSWLVLRGPGGTRTYTRDGALAVDDGVLRARGGAEVLGYPGGDARGAVAVPLRLPAADVALGRCADVRIDADGSVAFTRTAIEPRSGERSTERVVVGRVALARFPAGTHPERIDETHVAAPNGVVPHVGTPGDGTFPGLATRTREGGPVDIAAGVERLNEAYRAFQAIGAALKSRASVEKTTIDLVK
ncbi:MAG: hypothetical protein JOZ24_06730 [Candidatus Eremiobacteraeota bacterium]|nr:hypothetical protein [Candidatus Eremiobacteraeota bacterium]